MLVAVDVLGKINKGAQRWLDLGVVQLQPSELMKVALVLALARYFHGAYPEDMRRLPCCVPALLLILAPCGLVLVQPDLGTAVSCWSAARRMLFLAGVRCGSSRRSAPLGAAALPVLWANLHDYQRQRVFTFLDPETDPLGAGYHIIQSKIALGSGGLWGKGFLHGTPGPAQLPAREADRLRLHHAGRGAGLRRRVSVLALFLAADPAGPRRRRARAQPVRPPAGRRASCSTCSSTS